MAAADRDLLAENRPDCELKPIPPTRRTQTRAGGNHRRKPGIAHQVLVDRLRIRREVEHASKPRDDGRAAEKAPET